MCGRDVGNRILSIIAVMFSFKVISCMCHAAPKIHPLNSSLISLSDDKRENLSERHWSNFQKCSACMVSTMFGGVLSTSGVRSVNIPNQQ